MNSKTCWLHLFAYGGKLLPFETKKLMLITDSHFFFQEEQLKHHQVYEYEWIWHRLLKTGTILLAKVRTNIGGLKGLIEPL